MLEIIINFLNHTELPLFLFLMSALLVTFTENIFPPSPSDTVIVFMGSFVGLGKVGFIPLLIFSTIGSILGFALMFELGRKYGNRIIQSKKFKFITPESLDKPRLWFDKYGYWLIVGNRFLSGTRAVISFFAGISDLKFRLTLILSAASALVWNALLIFLGMEFGENWQLVDEYLSKFGKGITIATIAIILIVIARWLYKRRKK